MDFQKWLTALPRLLVLIPSAASCYYTVKNQMKYSVRKTAALCAAVLIPYSFLGAGLSVALSVQINTIVILSLILFFFLYRRTVTADFPKCLAIYVGVCAVQTFPAQFACSFDAVLHPDSGAAQFSMEAAFFQLGLSCLIAAVFAYPALQQFSLAVDELAFPKIWYITAALSSLFLFLNMLSVPLSYRTLHTGRMFYLFPLMELCALALLIAIYVLFFRVAMMILEHAKLKERSQLIEMQAHQYLILKRHISQTAGERHDFRHSVRLLSSLAKKGDIASIQTYLAEYEEKLPEEIPVNFCSNAALNALFGYYHTVAASARIKTEWRIGLPDPLPLSEPDLAALFGNLIENAIAGCKGQQKGVRYFCLTAEVNNGNTLYIVSTNSFNGQTQKGKTGYRSTKHGGTGIGLASITAIAEKYHGSARAYDNGREFFVDIMLRF